MGTPVQLIVPFASVNPYRVRNAGAVVGWLMGAKTLAGWELKIAAGFPSATFNKAKAVNREVDRSGAEILVLNDADTIVRPSAILAAVAAVEAGAGWCYAYRRYSRLGRLRTAVACGGGLGLESAFSGPYEQELMDPPAQAVMAIRRSAFLEVGGYAEGFSGGWGYEDLDFLERLLGTNWDGERIDAKAVHLWHGARRPDDSPLEFSASGVAKNLAYWNQRQVLRDGAPK